MFKCWGNYTLLHENFNWLLKSYLCMHAKVIIIKKYIFPYCCWVYQELVNNSFEHAMAQFHCAIQTYMKLKSQAETYMYMYICCDHKWNESVDKESLLLNEWNWHKMKSNDKQKVHEDVPVGIWTSFVGK